MTKTAFMKPSTTKKVDRIPVVCLECGKKFSVPATRTDAECPKCGGVDIEVR